jgi:hypothetical protein
VPEDHRHQTHWATQWVDKHKRCVAILFGFVLLQVTDFILQTSFFILPASSQSPAAKARSWSSLVPAQQH